MSIRNIKRFVNFLQENNFSKICHVTLIAIGFSCESFTEIDPPRTDIVPKTVFSDDATTTSAISGIFHQMVGETGFASGGLGSVTFMVGLSSDEFINAFTGEDQIGLYQNSLLPTNKIVESVWSDAYRFIFYANSVLEGITESQGLSLIVREQIRGEALFIRSFCHFYLAELFGDIPIVLTTDFETNRQLARSPQSIVYDQIISDLIIAKDLMRDDYSLFKNERVRPNKWTASALLARVFLNKGEWILAEEEASAIIGNVNLFSLEMDLNKVFLANSSEAIWQLKPVIPNINTREAQGFILKTTPVNVSISDELKNSFEVDDMRAIKWIGTFDDGSRIWYYPFKYKISRWFNAYRILDGV